MKIGRILCLCILLVSLLALFPTGLVLAQGEEVEEKIELEPTFRKLEATSPGAAFEFEISLKYEGSKMREFDLSAGGPADWSTSIKPSYGEQMIRSINLEPFKSYPDKIKVVASPPFFSTPEPGEYKITLEATSGALRDTIDLTAVITATYSLDLTPTSERLNTKATVGKDNIYSIVVHNDGSATLEDIKLSSSKPTGWSIEFSPEEIDTLPADGFQTIDVNIKPAPKTIAGDYSITLIANAKQARDTIDDVRVTVEVPTVWGWVGVGIILVVIAGVAFVFMRFSRR